MRFFKLQIILFVLAAFGVKAQTCSLVPVPLSDRVNSAKAVVEGKIVKKQSFWNDGHSQILTSYFIEVYKIFKGAGYTGDTVAFVVQGGQVDLDILVVKPAISLKIDDYGIFTLGEIPQSYRSSKIESENSKISFFRDNGWSQAFISTADNQVKDIFFNYEENNSPEVLYRAIEKITGNPAIEKKKKDSSFGNPANSPQKVMAIASFSPANVSAGTLGTKSVLTITGSGFGATRGGGYVRFKNADDGGATWVTVGSDLTSDYISWSDVQVQVRVPSGSGTGLFELRTNGGTTFGSGTSVLVDYNCMDVIYDPGSGALRYEPDLINDNGAAAGDYTLTYNTTFYSNAAAVAAFQDGLKNWVYDTGVNFVDAGASTSAISTNSGSDAVNIVSFNAGLGLGTLGVSYSSWSGCGTGGVFYWYLNDVDLLFSTVPYTGYTWYYTCTTAGITSSQYDFQSVATHELGHHHQLGHIINTGGVMHYSLSNGQVKRQIAITDKEGGDYVMAHSIISNACGPAAMTKITGTAPSCAPLTPLPIEILSFTGKRLNSEIELDWSTLSETNNLGFEIERSFDLETFNKIGFVKGAGNSTTINKYSFIDPVNQSRVYYYRLKQSDFDGQEKYIGPVAVNFETDGKFVLENIYPNPAGQYANLIFKGKAEEFTYKIVNLSGQVLLEQKTRCPENDVMQIGIENLKPGFYFIQIETKSDQFLKKFVKL